MAASASMSTVRKLGRVFGCCLPNEKTKGPPDVGRTSSSPPLAVPSSTQSVLHKESSKVTSNYHPPKIHEKPDSEHSLWDCAYEALKEENPELVLKYETLLSIELSEKSM